MFDPANFLYLAHELKSANSEAKIRTSISRAYYSAFLLSREWLRNQNWQIFDDGRDHKNVARGLRSKIDWATGYQLGSLYRDNRADADYVLAKTLTPKEADDAIQLSVAIINKFQPISLP